MTEQLEAWGGLQDVSCLAWSSRRVSCLKRIWCNKRSHWLRSAGLRCVRVPDWSTRITWPEHWAVIGPKCLVKLKIWWAACAALLPVLSSGSGWLTQTDQTCCDSNVSLSAPPTGSSNLCRRKERLFNTSGNYLNHKLVGWTTLNCINLKVLFCLETMSVNSKQKT